MTHSLRIGCVAVLRCCTAQLGYPSTDACAGDSSCASTRGCIPSVPVCVTAKTDLKRPGSVAMIPAVQSEPAPQRLGHQGLSAWPAVAGFLPDVTGQRSLRESRGVWQQAERSAPNPRLLSVDDNGGAGHLRAPYAAGAEAPDAGHVQASESLRHLQTALRQRVRAILVSLVSLLRLRGQCRYVAMIAVGSVKKSLRATS
jgi:hypothetical protein